METNKIKTTPETVEIPNLKIAKNNEEHSGKKDLKVTESVSEKRGRGRPAGRKNKTVKAKAKTTRT